METRLWLLGLLLIELLTLLRHEHPFDSSCPRRGSSSPSGACLARRTAGWGRRADERTLGSHLKVDYPVVLDMHKYCSDELKEKLQAPRQVSSTIAQEPCSMATDKADSAVAKKQLTAVYDLLAVLMHKGPRADAGYTASWVKQENGRWIQFNDDIITTHDEEEVLNLSGGDAGEHMAYICLYKARVV